MWKLGNLGRWLDVNGHRGAMEHERVPSQHIGIGGLDRENSYSRTRDDVRHDVYEKITITYIRPHRVIHSLALINSTSFFPSSLSNSDRASNSILCICARVNVPVGGLESSSSVTVANSDGGALIRGAGMMW